MWLSKHGKTPVMSVESPVLVSPYYEFSPAVQGFQYQSVWTPVVGKELPCNSNKLTVNYLKTRRL